MTTNALNTKTGKVENEITDASALVKKKFKKNQKKTDYNAKIWLWEKIFYYFW